MKQTSVAPLHGRNFVLSQDEKLAMFKTMVLINAVESALLDLFAKGKLRGTVHTSLGQEAMAVGVVGALDPSCDVVCSNHRGHGHFIAHGGDARGLIAEIMGRSDGICGGIGGSQHLHIDNFYSNGILGGMAPVAVGMAFAEKQRAGSGIVTLFMGDGALGEGVVYEAMNMAALWKLPILFAVEDNGYAQSTPKHLEHAGDLSRRGEPFGIPTVVLDGNDVISVRQAAIDFVSEIRSGSGPCMLYGNTYRLAPHSKGDDTRDPAEIAAAGDRAPIKRFREQLEPALAASAEAEVLKRVAALVAELSN